MQMLRDDEILRDEKNLKTERLIKWVCSCDGRVLFNINRTSKENLEEKDGGGLLQDTLGRSGLLCILFCSEG